MATITSYSMHILQCQMLDEFAYLPLEINIDVNVYVCAYIYIQTRKRRKACVCVCFSLPILCQLGLLPIEQPSKTWRAQPTINIVKIKEMKDFADSFDFFFEDKTMGIYITLNIVHCLQCCLHMVIAAGLVLHLSIDF